MNEWFVLFNFLGFPVFEHVLCPRVKALQMCTDKLRPAASAVYDVSVAYSSAVTPSGRERAPGPSLAGQF